MSSHSASFNSPMDFWSTLFIRHATTKFGLLISQSATGRESATCGRLPWELNLYTCAGAIPRADWVSPAWCVRYNIFPSVSAFILYETSRKQSGCVFLGSSNSGIHENISSARFIELFYFQKRERSLPSKRRKRRFRRVLWCCHWGCSRRN